jgi:hypothetical protein
VIQEVECLLCKCLLCKHEALSLNPNSTKKKKKKKIDFGPFILSSFGSNSAPRAAPDTSASLSPPLSLWRYQGWNSGLHDCWAGTLKPEPWLQPKGFDPYGFPSFIYSVTAAENGPIPSPAQISQSPADSTAASEHDWAQPKYATSFRIVG